MAATSPKKPQSATTTKSRAKNSAGKGLPETPQVSVHIFLPSLLTHGLYLFRERRPRGQRKLSQAMDHNPRYDILSAFTFPSDFLGRLLEIKGRINDNLPDVLYAQIDHSVLNVYIPRPGLSTCVSRQLSR